MERLGVDEFMHRNGVSSFHCIETDDNLKIKDWRKRTINEEKSSLRIYHNGFTPQITNVHHRRLESL